MYKKSLKLLFVLAFMTFFMTLFHGKSVKAENVTKELEPNTTVTDVVNEGDANWYKVTMVNSGYFTISLKMTNIVDAADVQLAVKLYDEKGTEIKEWLGYSSLDSFKISAQKGDVFYVVTERWTSKSASFDLKINNVADSSWEIEKNNSQDTATVLQSNKAIKGMILGDADEDWYQYTMPSTSGHVQFVLDKDVTIHESWGLQIFDKSGKKLKEYTGDGITSIDFPYSKGTKLYLKVIAYNFGAQWNEYTITPVFTKDSLWESEDNNSEKTATYLTAGKDKVYKGIIQSQVDGEDVDYYKFKVTAEEKGTTKNIKKVIIKFGPEQISNTGTWKVELINDAGKSVEMFCTDSKDTYQCYLKKGTYYIKVTAYSFNAQDKIYTINVQNSKVTQPTIELKSFKVTNNTSWSGLQGTCYLSKLTKGMTEFKLYYSTNSKMTNSKKVRVSSASKSIKVTNDFYYKNAKTIYFQVSALILDPFGNQIYESTKTPVKKVSVPKSAL